MVQKSFEDISPYEKAIAWVKNDCKTPLFSPAIQALVITAIKEKADRDSMRCKNCLHENLIGIDTPCAKCAITFIGSHFIEKTKDKQC